MLTVKHLHTLINDLTTVPEQFPIIFPTHKLNYICPVVILNVIIVHCYNCAILCVHYFFLSIVDQNTIFFKGFASVENHTCCYLCHATCKVGLPGTTLQLGSVMEYLCGRIWSQRVCSTKPVVFLVKDFPQRRLTKLTERIHSILHPGCLLLLSLNHGNTHVGLLPVIHPGSFPLHVILSCDLISQF